MLLFIIVKFKKFSNLWVLNDLSKNFNKMVVLNSFNIDKKDYSLSFLNFTYEIRTKSN